MSVNKVILIGNVGKDPEVRYLESGIPVATITLATSERGYTLANGTKVPEQTTWHTVIAWRGLAEIVEKYVKKGSQLFIEGKITNRYWEKDGIKKFITEIVAENIQLLGKRPDGQAEPNNTSKAPEPPSAEESSDDLPF